MPRQPTDVPIAAYLDSGPAKLDYEAVTHAGVKIEGGMRQS